MSVNKKNKNDDALTELTGKVVIKKFGAQSKSEHNAVCFETKRGEIIASGIIKDYTFFAKNLKEK